MTLLYNVLMLAVDGAILLGVWRLRVAVWRNGLLVVGLLVALGLGAALGEDGFGRLRLCAYGLFGHGTLVLAGATVLTARRSRVWKWVYGVIALILIAVAADAFLLEPHWLQVHEVRLVTDKVDRPVRIVVVADFQTDVIGRYERSVLKQAVAQRPDLLLFAGDYIETLDPTAFDRLGEEFREACRQADLKAPLGVYAIEGNVEEPGWTDLFADLPVVTVVPTRHFDLRLPGEGNGWRNTIRLTALSRPQSVSRNTRVSATQPFHIVVGHHPDYALSEEIHADLLIAGHTHGGQVWLPLLGPLVPRSRVPRDWASGRTRLDGGRTLLVSRGTGMKRNHAPRMRFLCRPELLVIQIVPKTPHAGSRDVSFR